MAIDYGTEWKKFRGKHGLCRINVRGKQVHVKQVMDNQVEETINKRESLMKEYLISGMETDITGGDKVCHWVCVSFRRNVYTTIKLIKQDFDAWCKKKGGK